MAQVQIRGEIRLVQASRSAELTSMAHTGTVKFFDDRKGYGFIEPVTGEADVFIHITAVERSGCGPIINGDTIITKSVLLGTETRWP